MKLSRYKNFESFVPKNLEGREKNAEEKGLLLYPNVPHVRLKSAEGNNSLFNIVVDASGIRVNFFKGPYTQLDCYLFVRIESGKVISLNFYDRLKKQQKVATKTWKDQNNLGSPISNKFLDRNIAESFFELLSKKWIYEPLERAINSEFVHKDNVQNLKKEAIKLAKNLKEQMIKKAEENDLIAQ